MKIIITQPFAMARHAAFQVGDVLDLRPEIAFRWIKEGIANAFEQVEKTSLSPAPETTSTLPSRTPRAQSSAHRSARK